MKHCLFIFLLVCSALTAAKKEPCVDMVIFSYDRPMQLYACLESVERYFTGINKIHIIYRTSTDEYLKAYKELCHRFSYAQFHKQSDLRAYDEFKEMVLTSVYKKKSPCRYVIFGVDDIIVKDFVDFNVCVKAMEETGAWGFFLRLGKNIDYTYTMKLVSPAPRGRNLDSHIFLWRFADGMGDWAYPNCLDMTVYRKSDIEYFLTNGQYVHPNYLEGRWSEVANLEQDGLCFQESKIVNLPMNLVTTFQSVFANGFSAKELLQKYKQGYKIDIGQFYRIKNHSPHEEYIPTFIPRN